MQGHGVKHPVHKVENVQRAALIGSLPESYREPLLLFTVRGMGHKQIAQLMNLTPTAVETRIRRARRLMRERAESGSESEKAIAT